MNKRGGKALQAEKHGIVKIKPKSIAYAVVQVHYFELFNTTVDLFLVSLSFA